MATSESKSSRSRGSRDMLTSLPDSLLHHIMSFMSTWQAVQLCVLSKRWKTLWSTLPVLNCGFNGPIHNSARVKSLVEFISTILLLREATSNLHIFTFDCDCRDVGLSDLLCTSIRPWIRYAIKRNLRVLTINIEISKTILYPSEIFICPSLVHVTLSSTGHIDAPEIINLPSLKHLHLKNAELNQDFMSKLLRGCPVLEDFHVEDGSVEVSDITSPSLKSLKIMTESHQGLIELINAPNLLSFQFVTCCCCQAKGINLNMPSLSEAYVEFAVCCKRLDVTKSSNILYSLFNVNRLELKANFYLSQEYLEAEISNCRTFSKLTCLSVGGVFCLNCYFDLLSSLLEHCPNLKKLSLVHLCHPFSCCQEPCKSFEQKKVARFKCEKLETVELKFLVEDRTFYRAVKCLQEAVIGLRNCRIIMTSENLLLGITGS